MLFCWDSQEIACGWFSEQANLISASYHGGTYDIRRGDDECGSNSLTRFWDASGEVRILEAFVRQAAFVADACHAGPLEKPQLVSPQLDEQLCAVTVSLLMTS